MALLHKATLTPSKLELLEGWAPGQPWFAGAGALAQVGSFRFDDPTGEVGIETLLVRSGDGPVLHLPLTYRAAPLEGAEEGLVGTLEHSVLGTRWVYDGPADPVYVGVVATVILNGGSHVEQHWVIEREVVEKPLDTFAEGTGGGAALGERPPVAGEPLVVDAVTTESGPESTLARARVHAGAGGLLLVEVVRRVAGEGSVSAEDAASAARAESATAVTGESALLLGRWPGEPDPRLLASATRG